MAISGPTSSRWRHPRRCPPSPRQPPARCSRSARCPTTDAPARSPSRAASRRAKPLTHRVLSHRRDITPAQAPRDGSAHSCGSSPGAVAKFPRIWAGNAAATGWWRPRQRGSATPRKLARPTCDLCPSYSPQILPYPGSPGTASGEPRQVCSISDKFIPPERRSSAAWRPRTGLGTGQVWILHGAAVYLRAHGAFRGAPEACRLRGAAIARRRRLCQLTVTPSTRSQCVCSASTPATVTPSALAYTG